jgi:predicted ArsR family transcriptional regulator
VKYPNTSAVAAPPGAHEQQTRAGVAKQLLERGPVTATEVADRLGVSPAGIRRHLDALVAASEATSIPAPARVPRGRGRPARRYLLTADGRSRFGHSSQGLADLGVDALRQLRLLGGDDAVHEFASRRVMAITNRVQVDAARDVSATADGLAQALTEAGYAASTRQVGNGVQICQHHCPVAPVAAEFPELCEAERSAFAELLGTHVQRLATIANGDPVCTTHVPTGQKSSPQQVPDRTALRKEHA